jgi:hypothetical protein
MAQQRTEQTLAAITDPGVFECLATAILREADSKYSALAHTGVNTAGKAIKSPVDGICFVRGSAPQHIITVHHTITARAGLKKKWLHPSEGDVAKAIALVSMERERTPELLATLVLTTNEEPDQAVVRELEAVAHDANINVDLWTRSRLCHFLDTQPIGHWIRRKYLGIDQELLSSELLHELSVKSLHTLTLMDDPSIWIQRKLDVELSSSLHREISFLVACSGFGKSAACYRLLSSYIESGGFGLILTDEIILSSMTLEHAITTTLNQLHPSLSSTGPSTMSYCTKDKPLLLLVEDINKSRQPQLLVEKLISWSCLRAGDANSILPNWRFICPLWPEVHATLSDQVRKRINSLLLVSGGFTNDEGREAVLARAALNGFRISAMDADLIAKALGYDPLLIALYDQRSAPDTIKIINQYVDNSLSRIAGGVGDKFPADYRQALRLLARHMLENHIIDPTWSEISSWPPLQGESLYLLGQIAHNGQLIRITGPSNNQRLSFRHDRVRDWLLADAIIDLESRDLLNDAVVGEPYFSLILGIALAWDGSSPGFLHRITSLNPLSLFHALRLVDKTNKSHHDSIVCAIEAWLSVPTTHDASNIHTRWKALSVLAETDSPSVLPILAKFRDKSISGDFACFRNGDLSGGINICLNAAPGVGAPWRDMQIDHVKIHFGKKLIDALSALLQKPDLSTGAIIGALRLAGHIADPILAPSIEFCWKADRQRSEHLQDYLWAFAECCAADPVRYLEPVCNAWAELPDKSDKDGWPSPRLEISAHELKWAFRKWPPYAAIDYFILRGGQDDLKWPITHLLDSIDDPRAVAFVVQELAVIYRWIVERKTFSPYITLVEDGWRSAQKDLNRPMSTVSRNVLLTIWQNAGNDKYLRMQAFSLWAATKYSADLDILRLVAPTEDLCEQLLRARLVRGDQTAIPALIGHIKNDDPVFWWYYGRYVWSSELSILLEDHFTIRSQNSSLKWGESADIDWITSELLLRLPKDEAESFLYRHWSHLRFSPSFVQVALYIGTPFLLQAVQTTVTECPEPVNLFKFLSHNFGLRMKDHPGLQTEDQVRVLIPYLRLISSLDILLLWEECNDHGWFTVRKLLDGKLDQKYSRSVWSRECAFSDLDNFTSARHAFHFNHWLEGHINAGVLWDNIFPVCFDGICTSLEIFTGIFNSPNISII